MVFPSDDDQGESIWEAGSCRLRRASRIGLRFHGSRASIASTVVASGSCWNTSLRYSKGSSPLTRAVITSENRLALAWAPTLS
jgi:hypothetical protein